MPVNGAGAQVEPVGDLGVGEALGHQTEHFDLPAGEPGGTPGLRSGRVSWRGEGGM
jgi:hypothetical protein